MTLNWNKEYMSTRPSPLRQEQFANLPGVPDSYQYRVVSESPQVQVSSISSPHPIHVDALQSRVAAGVTPPLIKTEKPKDFHPIHVDALQSRVAADASPPSKVSHQKDPIPPISSPHLIHVDVLQSRVAADVIPPSKISVPHPTQSTASWSGYGRGRGGRSFTSLKDPRRVAQLAAYVALTPTPPVSLDGDKAGEGFSSAAAIGSRVQITCSPSIPGPDGTCSSSGPRPQTTLTASGETATGREFPVDPSAAVGLVRVGPVWMPTSSPKPEPISSQTPYLEEIPFPSPAYVATPDEGDDVVPVLVEANVALSPKSVENIAAGLDPILVIAEPRVPRSLLEGCGSPQDELLPLTRHPNLTAAGLDPVLVNSVPLVPRSLLESVGAVPAFATVVQSPIVAARCSSPSADNGLRGEPTHSTSSSLLEDRGQLIAGIRLPNGPLPLTRHPNLIAAGLDPVLVNSVPLVPRSLLEECGSSYDGPITSTRHPNLTAAGLDPVLVNSVPLVHRSLLEECGSPQEPITSTSPSNSSPNVKRVDPVIVTVDTFPDIALAASPQFVTPAYCYYGADAPIRLPPFDCTDAVSIGADCRVPSKLHTHALPVDVAVPVAIAQETAHAAPNPPVSIPDGVPSSPPPTSEVIPDVFVNLAPNKPDYSVRRLRTGYEVIPTVELDRLGSFDCMTLAKYPPPLGLVLPLAVLSWIRKLSPGQTPDVIGRFFPFSYIISTTLDIHLCFTGHSGPGGQVWVAKVGAAETLFQSALEGDRVRRRQYGLFSLREAGPAKSPKNATAQYRVEASILCTFLGRSCGVYPSKTDNRFKRAVDKAHRNAGGHNGYLITFDSKDGRVNPDGTAYVELVNGLDTGQGPVYGAHTINDPYLLSYGGQGAKVNCYFDPVSRRCHPSVLILPVNGSCTLLEVVMRELFVHYGLQYWKTFHKYYGIPFSEDPLTLELFPKSAQLGVAKTLPTIPNTVVDLRTPPKASQVIDIRSDSPVMSKHAAAIRAGEALLNPINLVTPPQSPASPSRHTAASSNVEGYRATRTTGLVTELKENEIFVFGSNLQGRHGAGAALTAFRHFGAVTGCGEGLSGQAYGVPTKEFSNSQCVSLSLRRIQEHVDTFVSFARAHPRLVFKVTAIGCDLAGFRPIEIAPLFASAIRLDNVHLPLLFWDVLLHTARWACVGVPRLPAVGEEQTAFDEEEFALLAAHLAADDQECRAAELAISSVFAADGLRGMPLQVNSAFEYTAIMSALLERNVLTSKQSTEVLKQTDISLVWEVTVGKERQGQFTSTKFGAKGVGVDDTIELSHSAKSGQPGWVGNGVVTSAEGDEFIVKIKDETGVSFKDWTSGFVVSLSDKSVTAVRMQVALQAFSQEEACASAYIKRAIQGNPLPFERTHFVSVAEHNLDVPGLPPLNALQRAAVECTQQKALCLIQGPPGTGKTGTAAAIVYHLVRQRVGTILVCAPSNAAVNGIVRQLLLVGVTVLRMQSEAKASISELSVKTTMLHHLKNLSESHASDISKLMMLKEKCGGQLSQLDSRTLDRLRRSGDEKVLETVEVVACTCSAAGGWQVNRLRFPIVLIDEAAQSTEPETLIPIVLGCRQLILIGDEKQLGPLVDDERLRDTLHYGRSLYERLLFVGYPVIRLMTQYRMHPDLAIFPSTRFYNGTLQNGVTALDRIGSAPGFPWPHAFRSVVYNHKGLESISAAGHSCANEVEADIVTALVQLLLSHGAAPSDIAVMTPYTAHKTLLLSRFRKISSCCGVSVVSVDAYQGREIGYVILSLVRSNVSRRVGFVGSARRLNVALTRARYGLVIVGNFETLATDPLLSQLLQHHQELKAVKVWPLIESNRPPPSPPPSPPGSECGDECESETSDSTPLVARFGVAKCWSNVLSHISSCIRSCLGGAPVASPSTRHSFDSRQGHTSLHHADAFERANEESSPLTPIYARTNPGSTHCERLTTRFDKFAPVFKKRGEADAADAALEESLFRVRSGSSHRHSSVGLVEGRFAPIRSLWHHRLTPRSPPPSPPDKPSTAIGMLVDAGASMDASRDLAVNVPSAALLSLHKGMLCDLNLLNRLFKAIDRGVQVEAAAYAQFPSLPDDYDFTNLIPSLHRNGQSSYGSIGYVACAVMNGNAALRLAKSQLDEALHSPVRVRLLNRVDLASGVRRVLVEVRTCPRSYVSPLFLIYKNLAGVCEECEGSRDYFTRLWKDCKAARLIASPLLPSSTAIIRYLEERRRVLTDDRNPCKLVAICRCIYGIVMWGVADDMDHQTAARVALCDARSWDSRIDVLHSSRLISTPDMYERVADEACACYLTTPSRFDEVVDWMKQTGAAALELDRAYARARDEWNIADDERRLARSRAREAREKEDLAASAARKWAKFGFVRINVISEVAETVSPDYTPEPSRSPSRSPPGSYQWVRPEPPPRIDTSVWLSGWRAYFSATPGSVSLPSLPFGFPVVVEQTAPDVSHPEDYIPSWASPCTASVEQVERETPSPLHGSNVTSDAGSSAQHACLPVAYLSLPPAFGAPVEVGQVVHTAPFPSDRFDTPCPFVTIPSPPPSPPSRSLFITSDVPILPDDCWVRILTYVFDCNLADGHRMRLVSNAWGRHILGSSHSIAHLARSIVVGFPGLGGDAVKCSGSFRALCTSSRVQVLNLSSNCLTAASMVHLRGLIFLVSLNLSDNCLGGGHADPDVSFYLHYHPRLTDINLSNTQLGTHGLTCLHGLRVVRTLKVGNNMLGHPAILNSRRMREELWDKLEELDISNNDITFFSDSSNRDWDNFLCNCFNLRSLNICRNTLLARGLQQLVETQISPRVQQRLEVLLLDLAPQFAHFTAYAENYYAEIAQSLMRLDNLRELRVYVVYARARVRCQLLPPVVGDMVTRCLCTASVAGHQFVRFDVPAPDDVVFDAALDAGLPIHHFNDSLWLTFLSSVSARFRSSQEAERLRLRNGPMSRREQFIKKMLGHEDDAETAHSISRREQFIKKTLSHEDDAQSAHSPPPSPPGSPPSSSSSVSPVIPAIRLTVRDERAVRRDNLRDFTDRFLLLTPDCIEIILLKLGSLESTRRLRQLSEAWKGYVARFDAQLSDVVLLPPGLRSPRFPSIGCIFFIAAPFSVLDDCKKLLTLDISHNNLYAAAVSYLKCLTNLVDLNISHNTVGVRQGLDSPEFSLSLNPRLTSVDISYNRLDGVGLTCLDGLLNIRVLQVAWNKLNSAMSYQHMHSEQLGYDLWQNVESLNISNTFISITAPQQRGGYSFVNRCRNLLELDVRGFSISSNGMLRLVAWQVGLGIDQPRLEVLTFSLRLGTVDTVRTLQAVMHLGNLRDLAIYDHVAFDIRLNLRNATWTADQVETSHPYLNSPEWIAYIAGMHARAKVALEVRGVPRYELSFDAYKRAVIASFSTPASGGSILPLSFSSSSNVAGSSADHASMPPSLPPSPPSLLVHACAPLDVASVGDNYALSPPASPSDVIWPARGNVFGRMFERVTEAVCCFVHDVGSSLDRCSQSFLQARPVSLCATADVPSPPPSPPESECGDEPPELSWGSDSDDSTIDDDGPTSVFAVLGAQSVEARSAEYARIRCQLLPPCEGDLGLARSGMDVVRGRAGVLPPPQTEVSETVGVVLRYADGSLLVIRLDGLSLGIAVISLGRKSDLPRLALVYSALKEAVTAQLSGFADTASVIETLSDVVHQTPAGNGTYQVMQSAVDARGRASHGNRREQHCRLWVVDLPPQFRQPPLSDGSSFLTSAELSYRVSAVNLITNYLETQRNAAGRALGILLDVQPSTAVLVAAAVLGPSPVALAGATGFLSDNLPVDSCSSILDDKLVQILSERWVMKVSRGGHSPVAEALHSDYTAVCDLLRRRASPPRIVCAQLWVLYMGVVEQVTDWSECPFATIRVTGQTFQHIMQGKQTALARFNLPPFNDVGVGYLLKIASSTLSSCWALVDRVSLHASFIQEPLFPPNQHFPSAVAAHHSRLYPLYDSMTPACMLEQLATDDELNGQRIARTPDEQVLSAAKPGWSSLNNAPSNCANVVCWSFRVLTSVESFPLDLHSQRPLPLVGSSPDVTTSAPSLFVASVESMGTKFAEDKPDRHDGAAQALSHSVSSALHSDLPETPSITRVSAQIPPDVRSESPNKSPVDMLCGVPPRFKESPPMWEESMQSFVDIRSSDSDNALKVVVLHDGAANQVFMVNVDAICVMADCTSGRSRSAECLDGASDGDSGDPVRTQLAYGCPYRGRAGIMRHNRKCHQFATRDDRAKPGSISVFEAPIPMITPTVINLFAQWAGTATKTLDTRETDSTGDTILERLSWFRSCLIAITNECPQYKRLAFQFPQGGVLMADEDYPRFRKILAAFAKEHPDLDITLVKSSKEMAAQQLRAHQNVVDKVVAATNKALGEADLIDDVVTRTIARNLAYALGDVLLAVPLPPPVDGVNRADEDETSARRVLMSQVASQIVTNRALPYRPPDSGELSPLSADSTLGAFVYYLEQKIAITRDQQLAANRVDDEHYREQLRQRVSENLVTSEVLTASIQASYLCPEADAEVPATSKVYLVSPRVVTPADQSNGQQEHCERDLIRVGSRLGPRTPASVTLKLVGGQGELFDVPCCIPDVGAGTCMLSLSTYERLHRQDPTAITVVNKVSSSVSAILGIGGMGAVLFHVSFVLDLGGSQFRLEDVPVVSNQSFSASGILLGNDFSEAGNLDISFQKGLPDGCDGYVSVKDSQNKIISLPIPFSCKRSKTPASPAIFNASVASKPAEEMSYVIDNATPVAFSPTTVQVPPWTQMLIKVRIPAAINGDHPVALLPLNDPRVADLGIVIAPTISLPDAEGMMLCQVVNLTQKPINIPLLSQIARFVVNPKATKIDLQFTTEEILRDVHLEFGLSDSERQLITEMIEQRRRLFSSELGWAHGYKMHINTPRIDSGEFLPPASPSRRRPPEEFAALKAVVEKQLKGRIIEPVNSPYNAMPMCIKKPDGTFRIVLDYRALNLLTTRDTYPLPSIASNLAALGRANLFTTVDLLMGFHQCELDEESKLKTAFSTPWGQMAYSRMPMGLTSSPGTFMRLVDAALRGLPPGLALAYVDDIIIATQGSMEDHVRDVGLVFDRLIQAGFTVRSDKVHIGMKEVKYLGFVVGAYGTRPEARKIQGILDMAVEHMGVDPSAAARFTGMIGYFNQYIPNLHTTLAPFHELKNKNADARVIMESLRFKASFALLKHQLANVTANARPDYDKPFYIDVDSATTSGIGAVLSQRAVEDDALSHCPIACFSRRFSETERGYPVRDQECLGVADALTEWRSYVMGARVIVRTDHKSLKWLMTSNHKDGSSIAGWALKVQGYDIEIEYVPGKDHIVADCFSRTNTHEEEEKKGGDGEPVISSEEAKLLRLEEALEASLDSAGASSCVFNNSAFVKDTPHPIVTTSSGLESMACYLQSIWNSDVAAEQLTSLKSKSREVSETGTTDEALLEASLDSTGVSSCVFNNSALAEDPVTTTIASRTRGRGGWRPPGSHPRSPITRHGGRVALLLTQLVAGQVKVLVEQVDTSCGLPGLTVPASDRFSYRWQIRSYIRNSSLSDGVVKLLDNTLKSARGLKRSRTMQIAKNDYGKGTYFFISSLSTDPVIEESSVDGTIQWLSLTDELVARMSDDDDFNMLLGLTKAIVGYRRDREIGDHRIFDKLLRSMPFPEYESTSSIVAAAVVVEEVANISKFPFGPALIVTLDDATLAVSRLQQRLLNKPAVCMALDLEGILGGHLPRDRFGRGVHIALIQVCVDSTTADEVALTYVFDVHSNPAILRADGPSALRHLLADSAVMKVLHCSFGDASSLFVEYGVVLHGVFDTAIADCVLLNRHPNKSRSLSCVLTEWVGEDVVHLTHKGKLTHTPGMFEPRPLREHLFVYAYEDVVYCGRLFQVLCTQLRRRGLLELVFKLSDLRCPPFTLDPSHPLSMPAVQVVVALTDHRHVLCLETDLGVAFLPSQQILPEVALKLGQPLRAAARSAWLFWMGGALKKTEFAKAINSRLHKAVRLGDSLLLVADVSSCCVSFDEIQADLNSAPGLLTMTYKPVLRLCSQLQQNWQLDQLALFQHVQFEAARTFAPSLDDAVLPPPAVPSVVNVVTGRTLGEGRAALILYDQEFVYCIRSSSTSDELMFPAHQVMTCATPWDAALRGFDLFAGPALRKGSNREESQPVSPYLMFPSFIGRIATSLKHPRALGVFGNTEYFACELAGLTECRSIFAAAQRKVNGYRLTPTLEKKCFGHRIPTLSDAAQCLNLFDAQALLALISQITPSASPVPPSVYHCLEGSEAITAATIEEDVFIAHVFANFVELQRAEASVNAVMRAPRDSDWDATCTPPKFKVPTRAEVLEVQRLHPATSTLIDFLHFGSLSNVFMALSEVDQASVISRARDHRLATDGILERLSTDPRGRCQIVLPFQFHASICTAFHDRMGHLGTVKVLEMIRHRFTWGSTVEDMRKTVANHIKQCIPCQRAKLPRHHTGAFQVTSNGEYPYDIVASDEYKLGFTDDEGMTTVVTFACQFCREVCARAIVAAPDSEVIVNLLMECVVQYHGVPRFFRSDHASIYTSRCINLLWKLYQIKARAGTAYHHCSIGLVERWHSTLHRMILCHKACKLSVNMRTLLPMLVLAYNTTVNTAIGYAPSFINRLRHLRVPADVLDVPLAPTASKEDEIPAWVQRYYEEKGIVQDAVLHTLSMNSLHRKKIQDLKRDVVTQFRPGDRVLLIKGLVIDKRIPKAEEPTEGPYTVDRDMGQDNYRLRDLHSRRIYEVVHISRLLPYPARLTSPGVAFVDTWPVKAIVGRRVQVDVDRNIAEDGVAHEEVLEYRIRWLGCGSKEDSWRSNHYLDTVAELVAEYNRKHPLPEAHASLTPAFEARDNPAGQPPPSAEALRRPHFRAVARPRVEVEPTTAPLAAPLEGPPALPVSRDLLSPWRLAATPSSPADNSRPISQHPIVITDSPRVLRARAPPIAIAPSRVITPPPTVLDPYPVDSRIEAMWGDGVWYRGSVVASSVLATKRGHERLISIKYDDSPTELHQHLVNDRSNFRFERALRTARRQ